MKALILGGSGFIGTHLAAALSEKKIDVLVFDRAPCRALCSSGRIEYLLGDLDDTAAVAEALCGIDVVYHLACNSLPGTSNLDPVDDIQSNLVTTIRLLNKMLELSVSRIVFLSSGGTVYGNPKQPLVTETEPVKPLCSYGIVKVAIENYLEMYRHLRGLIPTIIRPSNPFGPWQSHIGVQGLIATIFHKMMQDEPITVWGDGSIVRDYLYISDLIDLCVKAGLADVMGVFNAGYGKGYAINAIIEKIAAITGRSPRIEYLSGRPFDVKTNVLNISAAMDTFGWTPKVSIDEGLRRYWVWLSHG